MEKLISLIFSICAAAGFCAGAVAHESHNAAQHGAPEEASSKIVSLASHFPAADEFQFDPPVPGTYKLNQVFKAPDGEVIDILGQDQDLSSLTEGKITLVSFVYLSCADLHGCPTAISTLFDIHERSLDMDVVEKDVQLMTISFDPMMDTVEAINDFAYPITSDVQAAQKMDWHVLTTANLETLQPILDGYGQVVDRSGDENKINHLLRMFLVDREGQVRNVYGLGFIDPRLLMTDIETLLLEEEARL